MEVTWTSFYQFASRNWQSVILGGHSSAFEHFHQVVTSHDYVYRYRNTKPQSQSGLLFPWGFYELCAGLHDDACGGLLSPWMVAVIDSYGCFQCHLRSSVVVRQFLLQICLQGKQKQKRRDPLFSKFPGSYQNPLAGWSLKEEWKMLKSSWEVLQKQER